MDELSDLPNIGSVLTGQLHAVGVKTPAELREQGSKRVWLKIKATDPSACYQRLCAIEGAVRGIRWHALPEEVKQDLKVFYRAHK